MTRARVGVSRNVESSPGKPVGELAVVTEATSRASARSALSDFLSFSMRFDVRFIDNGPLAATGSDATPLPTRAHPPRQSKKQSEERSAHMIRGRLAW